MKLNYVDKRDWGARIVGLKLKEGIFRSILSNAVFIVALNAKKVSIIKYMPFTLANVTKNKISILR